MRIAVDKKDYPVATTGIAGMEATSVKRVPTILDRHEP